LIPTLEGQMTADVDDWIIKGVRGEFYPCKPYIFDEIYSAEAALPPDTAPAPDYCTTDDVAKYLDAEDGTENPCSRHSECYCSCHKGIGAMHCYPCCKGKCETCGRYVKETFGLELSSPSSDSDTSAPDPLRVAAEEALDSERYRYMRDVAFKSANVNLGEDSDRNPYVEFCPRIAIPELSFLQYEDREWTSEMIDAAIDAARNA
jgi:hypothetical protein